MNCTNTFSDLSNDTLVSHLKSLVSSEREILAQIVQYLHVVDCRRLYEERGFSSLFAFCREELRYSESSAYRRIQAARFLGTNPEVLSKIRTGELSLAAIAEISRVAEADKRAELVRISSGKSKEKVKELVAEVLPLAAPRRVEPKVTVVAVAPSPLFASVSAESEAARVEKRYTVTLDLSEEEYRLLEEVQCIVSERQRSKAIVRVLKVYRKLYSPKERAKRRDTRRQRAAERSAKSIEVKAQSWTEEEAEEVHVTAKVIRRAIPQRLRDNVTVRDECRCTYVSPDGHRCSETAHIEIDHIKPYSIGGEHSEENLRLLCRAHNRLAYERFVTRGKVAQEGRV